LGTSLPKFCKRNYRDGYKKPPPSAVSVRDLPSLTTFSAEETTQLVLGNLPAQALQKELQRWIQEATPICGEYAYVLRTHITSLQPAVVDMSSDDEGAAS